MSASEDAVTLKTVVRDAVHRVPAVDMHTHLYDPRFGDLLLRGVDELLTYHYLVAELFRFRPTIRKGSEATPLTPDAFFDFTKPQQAEWVWRTLFLENSPLSEATRGVLTSFGMMGLDAKSRNLEDYRRHFADLSAAEHIDRVFKAANLESAVMTNDPFDDAERPLWMKPGTGDKRFPASLRIDPLLADWKAASKRLKQWGYAVKSKADKITHREIRRFLDDWRERIQPLYLAASVGDAFDAGDGSEGANILHHAVLPFCRERRLPFALMIGCRKQINPALRLAGDGVRAVDLRWVEKLAAACPDNRFLVTTLSREDQHTLCVIARKFANLMPFGCWWFLNDPMTVDEMTRMRLELLGTSFIPQHSDARVLDQAAYKWAHSRRLIGRALQDKYEDLFRTGWRATAEEIERDARNLLSGNFKRFVGMKD